jgi:hypothetical protein
MYLIVLKMKQYVSVLYTRGCSKLYTFPLVHPSTKNYSTIHVRKYTKSTHQYFGNIYRLVYSPLKTNESGIHFLETVRPVPNQDPSLVLVRYQTLLTYIYSFSISASILLFCPLLPKSETYLLGPTIFFRTIRYMQPVSALSPSFFSSSS